MVGALLILGVLGLVVVVWVVGFALRASVRGSPGAAPEDRELNRGSDDSVPS